MLDGQSTLMLLNGCIVDISPLQLKRSQPTPQKVVISPTILVELNPPKRKHRLTNRTKPSSSSAEIKQIQERPEQSRQKQQIVEDTPRQYMQVAQSVQNETVIRQVHPKSLSSTLAQPKQFIQCGRSEPELNEMSSKVAAINKAWATNDSSNITT